MLTEIELELKNAALSTFDMLECVGLSQVIRTPRRHRCHQAVYNTVLTSRKRMPLPVISGHGELGGHMWMPTCVIALSSSDPVGWLAQHPS